MKGEWAQHNGSIPKIFHFHCKDLMIYWPIFVNQIRGKIYFLHQIFFRSFLAPSRKLVPKIYWCLQLVTSNSWKHEIFLSGWMFWRNEKLSWFDQTPKFMLRCSFLIAWFQSHVYSKRRSLHLSKPSWIQSLKSIKGFFVLS